jgi:hypothetical protein
MVKEINSQYHKLVIGSTAAKLTIAKSQRHGDVGVWSAEWQVTHYQRLGIHATGRTQFTDTELAAAFGLIEQPCSEESLWLFHQYGAEAGEQGVFIRMGNHLNIPGPGTGHDGDANMSLYVDWTMQEAVRRLLKSQ